MVIKKSRSEFLAISVLLLIAVSSCTITRNYRNEAISKWEKEVLEFKKSDSLEHDPTNAILFTGSSSIRLWSTIKEDMAPYPVIQRGFGGSKFSDLSVYAKDIIYPHQFRALVIFEANDITGDKSDKTPDQVAKLFREIISTVRMKYAKEPIFVVEITPNSSRWASWTKIKRTNQLLRESCSDNANTWFIETSASYLNNSGEPRNELFRTDLLHQNRDGYSIWGALIRKKLDQVLVEIPKN